jgi:Tol biopolymer transport system component
MEIAALNLLERQARSLVPAIEHRAQFSPDGHWLAYFSTDSGRREVLVTDFPAAKVRKPVSTNGGFAPAWSPDGRELFYVSDASMMAQLSSRARQSSSSGRYGCSAGSTLLRRHRHTRWHQMGGS